jgi:hypothetical protein
MVIMADQLSLVTCTPQANQLTGHGGGELNVQEPRRDPWDHSRTRAKRLV